MPLENDSLLNDRYRIVKTIASGGMGAIYRATDETLGISVAVKENFFSTEDFSRQFRREATILASLRHPNLPRVTDHFVISGRGQYLVMDYIEGSDLREIIAERGALPEEDVVRIGVAICDALEYLHTRNPAIVHRDIKPGNLKITSAGHVYLVDFGLAKLSRGEATTIGAQALTPGYAPPEQYGQGTEPRSDLYALGATLYAALTGEIPEDGLSRIMGNKDLTPIRSHNPKATTRIAEVIEHSMAVVINNRYQSADVFKQALIAAAPKVKVDQPVSVAEKQDPTRQAHREPIQSAPVPTPTPPPPDRTARSRGEARPADHQVAIPEAPPAVRKTNFAPVLLGVLGGLFLIGVIAFFLIPGVRSSFMSIVPAAQVTNTSPTISTAPLATATLPPEPTQPVAPPPTQAASPTTQPTSAPTSTSSPTKPSPTETDLPSPTPQPENTNIGGGSGQIAFSSDQGGSIQIWIIDANGANPHQITKLGDGACQPSWSPDGQRIAFISPCAENKEDYPGASLYLINADGTGLVPLASAPGGDYDPAWSPDGNFIAFTTLRDNSIPHIYLYNLADNTTTRLSRIVNYERQPAWSPDGNLLAYQTTRLGEPQIWTMTAKGENAQEFSILGNGFESRPVWAPDGKYLYYTQGTGSQAQLVSRKIGDKQAKEITLADKNRPATAANCSPDGRWLLFEMKKDNNLDIYLMLTTGGNLTRLTTQPGLDFHAVWRPANKASAGSPYQN